MADIKAGDLVAVYGSLREGLGNHRVISQGIYRGDDRILAMFNMYSLGCYPVIIPEYGAKDIVVELYEMPNDGGAQAQRLDHLEGYPKFYDRKVVMTEGGHRVWVYFMASYDNLGEKVEHGDWSVYRNAWRPFK